MQARVLLSLLANVPPDTEVIIDTGNYDLEVGGITYSEQYGTIFITAVEDEETPGTSETDDDDASEEYTDDDDEKCPSSGNTCALPEPTNSAIELI